MFLDAAVVAALCGLSIIYLSDRMPEKLKNFFKKNNIATDVVAFLVAYALLGGTITAMMAGVLVIGVVEALLHIANNPDDFLYLWDLKRDLGESIAELKTGLKEYGEEYRGRITVIDGGRG